MELIINVLLIYFGLCALSGLLYRHIVNLFATVVFSKVISIVLCVAAIVISLLAVPDYMMMLSESGSGPVYLPDDSSSGWMNFISLFPVIVVPITALAWLFYSGARIFDVEYDGSFRLYDVGDGYVPVPKQTGGFWGNFGFALVIIAIFWFIGGALDGLAVMVFVPPLGILIFNVIALIKAWRERDEY